MGRRTKELAPRPCERCGALTQRLVRVKASEHAPWLMVCYACWPALGEGNADYQYGGEWRAKKRR